MNAFQYVETTLTNLNSFQGKLRGGGSQGMFFYHSMQNLFSSRSLIKIKINGIIILPVVLYTCEHGQSN